MLYLTYASRRFGHSVIPNKQFEVSEKVASASQPKFKSANDGISRYVLWNLLRRIGRTTDKEWLLMGDFNEVINTEEKMTCVNIFINNSGLKDCCIDLELQDLKSIGLFYTWCNNQDKMNWIYYKLDRAMGNTAWFDRLGNSYFDFQSSIMSDHAISLQSFNCKEHVLGHPSFKYLNVWQDFEQYEKVVSEAWNLEAQNDGNPIFRMYKRLENIK